MATWLCANKFFYKSMGDNSLTQIVPRFVYIIDKSSCYFNFTSSYFVASTFFVSSSTMML